MTYPHIGNKEEKEKMLISIKNGRHILLVGKQGRGKTSFVDRLKRFWDVLEINASEHSTKDAVKSIFNRAMGYKSITKSRRIIFFDEADFFSSEASDVVAAALDVSTTTIILAANYINKIKKNIAEHKNIDIITFYDPSPKDIYELLLKIKNKEKIKVSNEDIVIIAKECKGDVRAAIKSLKHGSEGYNERIIENATKLATRIFNMKNRKELYEKLLENVDIQDEKNNFDYEIEDGDRVSIVTLLLYLVENIPNFYSKITNLLLASEAISTVDLTLFKSDPKYQLALLSFLFPIKDDNIKEVSIHRTKYKYKWRKK